jgi:hypothetical protein
MEDEAHRGFFRPKGTKMSHIFVPLAEKIQE